MMKEIFRGFCRRSASAIKKVDVIANYKVGGVIRSITNTNTRRYWDKKLASYGQSWRDFSYSYLLEFLAKDCFFSLLDIGCALGDGCVLLKTHFPRAEISGADFSKVGIGKAKERTEKVHFLLLDIGKEDPPKKYDYITLMSTLEHFNNPFPIVDRCLKFVNKALIICVPYTEQFDEPRLYSRGLHRYLFNEKTFGGYHFKILQVTEFIESTGYRYIIYKLKPDNDKRFS